MKQTQIKPNLVGICIRLSENGVVLMYVKKWVIVSHCIVVVYQWPTHT